jgi:hypothetical protein
VSWHLAQFGNVVALFRATRGTTRARSFAVGARIPWKRISYKPNTKIEIDAAYVRSLVSALAKIAALSKFVL